MALAGEFAVCVYIYICLMAFAIDFSSSPFSITDSWSATAQEKMAASNNKTQAHYV